ncbi:ADAM 17-like protease isoform X2 [Halichondria panicea]|uniref:ADAM 17-like protease isoform X2 n=1 Tax=Halichondria panicea TaxID=6063 RepID=UPI00312BAF3E
MAVLICIVLLALIALTESHAGSIPDDHHLYHALHHFEVVHKDHLTHSTITERTYQRLHFKTLGREFHLLLRPRRDPLRNGLQAIVIGEGGVQELVDINTDHHLTGTLADDPHSTVHAHYDRTEGLLSAAILTSMDHYYIEPSHRHFSQSHDFHMISYRGSDIKYNLTGDPNQHFCGVGHNQYPSNSQQSHDNVFSLSKAPHKDEGRYGNSGKERLRRQAAGRKLLCPLSLVATHKFHQFFSTDGNIRNSINFIISVVDMADQIFRDSKWSEDIGQRGFSFSSIRIHNTSTTEPVYNSNPPGGGWLSEDLLVAFSQADWSKVCLAHLFTAESFTDNRLGVAYIASSQAHINGGICSPVTRNSGQPPSTANVGVSSFFQGSRPLLLAEAKLVLAHELGHNWGSEHDPTGGGVSLCNPDFNEGGKFLMFPSATDGQQDNNKILSPCSRQSVSDVLRVKTSCFIDVENMPTQCGDFVVDLEGGEECDAGPDSMLSLDPCCDNLCQFRPQAVCSDVNEECCNGCSYATSSTPCKTYPANSDTCLQNVTCSGLSGSCPSEEKFVNVTTLCQGSGLCLLADTQCNNSLPCNSAPVSSPTDRLVCFNLCEQQNMTQCFCEPLSDNECLVCCQEKVVNSTCAPLSSNTLLVDGSTCLGGVCRLGRCEITTQDLASRLFNLFSTISINAFIEFMSENVVSSVLFIVTILWIPPSIIVSIIITKIGEISLKLLTNRR